MLTELDTIYRKIEERRTEMINRLEALPDAEQMMPPTTLEWSALQVVEHLIMYEELVCNWRARAVGATASPSWKGRGFVGLMTWIMRSRLRIPTLPELQPQSESTLLALCERWRVVRVNLRTGLEAVTQERLPTVFILHPIAGPLNAMQVLQLLDAHLMYHQRHWPLEKKPSH